MLVEEKKHKNKYLSCWISNVFPWARNPKDSKVLLFWKVFSVVVSESIYLGFFSLMFILNLRGSYFFSIPTSEECRVGMFWMKKYSNWRNFQAKNRVIHSKLTTCLCSYQVSSILSRATHQYLNETNVRSTNNQMGSNVSKKHLFLMGARISFNKQPFFGYS